MEATKVAALGQYEAVGGTIFKHVDASDKSRVVTVAECSLPERAAFIVRACNAHDDLLAALEQIALTYSYGPGDIARAAIAKAQP